MRGHYFSWFTVREGARWEDPPPDCRCHYCGTRYADIEDLHFCVSRWAQHPDRLAFTRALQGVE